MKLSPVSALLLKLMVPISILGAIIAVIFVYNRTGFLISFAAGLVLVIVRLIMIEFAVNKVISDGGITRKEASVQMRLAYFSRTFIMLAVGVPIIIFFGLSGMIGLVIPAISLTIATYVSRFFKIKEVQ